MIYKKVAGENLSALGLGMMRLPLTGKSDEQVDELTVADMIAYALGHGINYFDTAWGYHNGVSELVAGKFLSAYPRESYKLASKFPGYDLDNMPKVREIFQKQLEKCRTDYFDFYLFHNVCEVNIDGYLDRSFGIYEHLIEQKKKGRIKHLGFSVHGELPVMQRFLDAYAADMEFCQIQLNWLDWDFQNAKAKVELAKKYGLPVWVMEPVRGGKLAKLSDEHAARLAALREGVPAVEWAFRFIQSIPEVGMTLSGMSDMEQLKQNIEIFSQEKPLEPAEWDALMDIAADMTSKKSLPCTACRYCTTKCPLGLDIPEIIRLYNEHVFSGGGFLAPMALSALDTDKRPSACIGCRNCEKVCPQRIRVSEMMKDFSKLLSSGD